MFEFIGSILKNLFLKPASNVDKGMEEIIDQKANCILVHMEECTLCGECAQVCPSGALFVDKKLWKIDSFNCVTCKNCIERCSNRCIYLNFDVSKPSLSRYKSKFTKK